MKKFIRRLIFRQNVDEFSQTTMIIGIILGPKVIRKPSASKISNGRVGIINQIGKENFAIDLLINLVKINALGVALLANEKQQKDSNLVVMRAFQIVKKIIKNHDIYFLQTIH